MKTKTPLLLCCLFFQPTVFLMAIPTDFEKQAEQGASRQHQEIRRITLEEDVRSGEQQHQGVLNLDGRSEGATIAEQVEQEALSFSSSLAEETVQAAEQSIVQSQELQETLKKEGPLESSVTEVLKEKTIMAVDQWRAIAMKLQAQEAQGTEASKMLSLTINASQIAAQEEEKTLELLDPSKTPGDRSEALSPAATAPLTTPSEAFSTISRIPSSILSSKKKAFEPDQPFIVAVLHAVLGRSQKELRDSYRKINKLWSKSKKIWEQRDAASLQLRILKKKQETALQKLELEQKIQESTNLEETFLGKVAHYGVLGGRVLQCINIPIVNLAGICDGAAAVAEEANEQRTRHPLKMAQKAVNQLAKKIEQERLLLKRLEPLAAQFEGKVDHVETKIRKKEAHESWQLVESFYLPPVFDENFSQQYAMKLIKRMQLNPSWGGKIITELQSNPDLFREEVKQAWSQRAAFSLNYHDALKSDDSFEQKKYLGLQQKHAEKVQGSQKADENRNKAEKQVARFEEEKQKAEEIQKKADQELSHIEDLLEDTHNKKGSHNSLDLLKKKTAQRALIKVARRDMDKNQYYLNRALEELHELEIVATQAIEAEKDLAIQCDATRIIIERDIERALARKMGDAAAWDYYWSSPTDTLSFSAERALGVPPKFSKSHSGIFSSLFSEDHSGKNFSGLGPREFSINDISKPSLLRRESSDLSLSEAENYVKDDSDIGRDLASALAGEGKGAAFQISLINGKLNAESYDPEDSKSAEEEASSGTMGLTPRSQEEQYLSQEIASLEPGTRAQTLLESMKQALSHAKEEGSKAIKIGDKAAIKPDKEAIPLWEKASQQAHQVQQAYHDLQEVAQEAIIPIQEEIKALQKSIGQAQQEETSGEVLSKQGLGKTSSDASLSAQGENRKVDMLTKKERALKKAEEIVLRNIDRSKYKAADWEVKKMLYDAEKEADLVFIKQDELRQEGRLQRGFVGTTKNVIAAYDQVKAKCAANLEQYPKAPLRFRSSWVTALEKAEHDRVFWQSKEDLYKTKG